MVSNKIWRDLEGLQGVNGFSLAPRRRLRGGKLLDEKVLRVYVEQKTQFVPKDAFVPEYLSGLPTDVVQIGKVDALAFMDESSSFFSQSHKINYRPVLGGVSGGHTKATGTIGGPAFLDDELMGISNNHVMSVCNTAKIGDPILQRGAVDGGTLKDKAFTLEGFVEINFDEGSFNQCDAAWARPVNDSVFKPEILEIGLPKGVGVPLVGQQKIKSGRNGLTTGTCVDDLALIKVGYGQYGSAAFDSCVLNTRMSSPGDSGSFNNERNSFVTTDHHFAGSQTVSLGYQFRNLFAQTDLKPFTGVIDDRRVKVDLHFTLLEGKYLVYGNCLSGEKRLSGVDVVLDLDKSVKSDQNGYFEFTGVGTGPHVLNGGLNGYSEAESSFTI